MKADLSWSLDPVPTAVALAVLALYGWRWRTVRHSDGARAASVPRLALFTLAVLAGLAALDSPIDSLADQLFVMHMVQHIILLDIAPVLGLLGLTRGLLRPVTRGLAGVERSHRWLMSPWLALVLYVTVVWAWHIPSAYDAALRHPHSVHVLEHLTFVLAGGLYWWHILSPVRGRLSRGSMGPVLYMLTTKVLVGALGMGLAFAPSALYPFYEHAGRIWGLSATTDQNLAGVTMALEQSLVMGVALAWLFMRALAESDREQERRERYELI